MSPTLGRLAAGAALVAGAVVAWLGFVWPPPSWWRTHWPAQTAFMTMRARQLRGDDRAPPRRYLPIAAATMSVWLPRAAMAGEDEAFYLHHGIDYRALREAMGYRRASFSWRSAADRAELWRALEQSWSRRARLRGASTITQQLAKNLYLSPSRNPLRKLKEAVIAYRLEWALDKDRILALYLNVAEFGPNVWGVEAASERYFGRGARHLSAEQAAMLIATLPHPLTSNPAYRPGRTRWRQELILLKLGGAPVTVPPEEQEDTVPAQLAPLAGDTTSRADAAGDTLRSRTDSAAVPPKTPDTTADSSKIPVLPGPPR
ncbi:MAG TPA: biosynthetic peptidoglycan transglycosylase [Gemmatimonadales bacterium]|nr:biosynthetic peptidoglycan transglycosylase [Gemmatimonadales bacterium]